MNDRIQKNLYELNKKKLLVAVIISTLVIWPEVAVGFYQSTSII